MAILVYTIAHPRKTLCIPKHDSSTAFPRSILKAPSGLDALWRRNGAWLRLRDVFAVIRGIGSRVFALV